MRSRWPCAANSPDAVKYRRVVVGRHAAGELHTPQAGRVVGRELVSVQGADPDEIFKALQLGADRGQVRSVAVHTGPHVHLAPASNERAERARLREHRVPGLKVGNAAVGVVAKYGDPARCGEAL